jgi:hypothetical protein
VVLRKLVHPVSSTFALPLPLVWAIAMAVTSTLSFRRPRRFGGDGSPRRSSSAAWVCGPNVTRWRAAAVRFARSRRSRASYRHEATYKPTSCKSSHLPRSTFLLYNGSVTRLDCRTFLIGRRLFIRGGKVGPKLVVLICRCGSESRDDEFDASVPFCTKSTSSSGS